MKPALIIVTILLFLGGIILLKETIKNEGPSSSSSVISPPASTPQTQAIDIQASFQIITQGTLRSFKNPKYHQRSSDVYISADDPTIVNVKKASITWDDFFKTLPMELTKDCLITGDGETFCSGSSSTLQFFLNDKEDPNLLDREIRDGDKVLIKF